MEELTVLDSVRKCLVFLPPQARLGWAGLIPLALAAALLESVGAAAVFVFAAIISDPAQIATLPLSATVYRVLPWREGTELIQSFTVLLAIFYLLKNGFLAAVVYLQNRVVSNSSAELAARLLKSYLTVPYSFHLQRNSAELIRTTLQSVRIAFERVMEPAVGIITEGLITLGICAVLVATAPAATIVAALVLSLLAGVLVRASHHYVAHLGSREQELEGEALKTLQQSLGALKEVKVMGRERFFCTRFADFQHALFGVRHLITTLSIVPKLLVETVFVCGMLVVVGMIAANASSTPELLPLLGLYAYAGFRIIPSVNRILARLTLMRAGTAAVELLHRDLAVLGADVPKKIGTRVGSRASSTDRIELRGVSYTYEGAVAPALQDINLTIARGESVGVVGPTGAGKSTLIHLVLGLLNPSIGEVTVDNQRVSGKKSSWPSQVGYVPQEIFLLDDSLRRNIAFGLTDDEIDESKVLTAVRMAQLESFVDELPAGLDTVVGERGVRLSGGQRQRVAIARSLYPEPDLIVFDEATSALDNRTESELSSAIQTLRGRRTLIIIAHRLSTVRSCDRLIFLYNGRVAGAGTFAELIESNPNFRRMVARANPNERIHVGNR